MQRKVKQKQDKINKFTIFHFNNTTTIFEYKLIK